jgi:hypothetical protein
MQELRLVKESVRFRTSKTSAAELTSSRVHVMFAV